MWLRDPGLGFRDVHPQVKGKKAIVLGVSPDGVASYQAFKTKFQLPFPFLVDSDHKIAEAYSVWQEKSMCGRKLMGVARSHFVIDEQGKVVAVRYNVAPEASLELSIKIL